MTVDIEDFSLFTLCAVHGGVGKYIKSLSRDIWDDLPNPLPLKEILTRLNIDLEKHSVNIIDVCYILQDRRHRNIKGVE